MQLLRSLCSHKHQFLALSSKPSFISCKSSLNPKFPRQFHSSFLLTASQESSILDSPVITGWSTVSDSQNGSSVQAVYDPVSGGLRTTRVKGQINNREESCDQKSTSKEEDGEVMGSRVYGDVVNKSKKRGFAKGKEKGKSKTVYVCSSCGHSEGQWWGYCKECNESGSLKEFSVDTGNGNGGGKVTGFEVSENIMRSWLPSTNSHTGPIRLTDVYKGIIPQEWRISLSGLFGAELGRVLGGGLVPGSLVLVGGDPGVGKSTLLLQTAALIAGGYGNDAMSGSSPVIYVSGEESVDQIGNRADRLGISATELFLYASTDVEDILEKVQALSPRALVVDSIQTVYLRGVFGSAGSINQVKECTSALLRYAKTTKVPVLLAGHVNKSGDIAGPRVLEHIVDVVLYMEGEKYSSHRLVRPSKNRFGSTDELGIFEMSTSGLQAVTNPSEMFLNEDRSDSEILVGLAVAVTMDVSRAFLVEVQALCITSSSSRQLNGVPPGRAEMIIAVLRKQAGLKLQETGIFLNVISGVTLSETAADLSIAAAICSSFLEHPIPQGIAFVGEIGLGGEILMVPRMDKRVYTVARLGYNMCVVPKSAEKHLSEMDFGGMELLFCKNLKEMIHAVFRAT